MTELDGRTTRFGMPEMRRPMLGADRVIPSSLSGGISHPLRAVDRRFHKTSILTRSLALVALGLCALFAGFVLLTSQFIRESTNRTLQERQLIAQATAKSLDDRFAQIATVVSVEAARLPTTGGDSTESTRAAWRALRLQFGSTIQRVVAIDDQLQVRWTTPYDVSLLGLDLSQVSAAREALQGRETVIDDTRLLGVPPALSLSSTDPTVSIFCPAGSAQDRAVLIILDLNQPGMADLLKQVVLGQTGFTEVIGRDGRVLASPRSNRLGTVSDHGGQLASLIRGGNSFAGTCHDCHSGSQMTNVGEEVLAFSPLSSAPLGVAVRQSSQEALAFGDDLFRRALLFGVVSLLLTLIVSSLLVIRLVRPVKVLTNACLQIAEGDLQKPVPPMGGGEIGTLAASFETMRRRLRASESEIRRWGRELEQKVMERTAELREARDGLQRSRDFLFTLFNSQEDQLAVIDGNYRVVEANRALAHKHGDGWSPIGRPCYAAFHAAEERCEPRCGSCPVRMVWETGRPSQASQVHLEGHSRPAYLDVVASPIRDESGRVVSVLEVARDVTTSKRLEEQALRTSEELSALISLSSTIARSMDLRAMLGTALSHVLLLMGAPSGGIVIDGADEGGKTTLVTRNMDAREIKRLSSAPMSGPQRRRVFRKIRRNGSEVVCVPISTRQRDLGEMFISCPANARAGFARIEQHLLTSIGSQLAVAIEGAQLYEALQRKEEAMGDFMRKYIAVQEEERKRIARELHDDTAQSLAALSMTIDAALRAPTATADELKSLLEPAAPLAERISSEIDRIIRDLRPSLLDDLGLLEALGWYVDHRLKPLGIQVVSETIGCERRLPPELETTLFRVGQEAISNIARHSGAENVAMTVDFGADYVALDVEDDGCGFDSLAVAASGSNDASDGSFGLLGMRERVTLLRGSISVHSQPGQGTSIKVRVPLTTN